MCLAVKNMKHIGLMIQKELFILMTKFLVTVLISLLQEFDHQVYGLYQNIFF